MPLELPDRVEAGTLNVPGICGLGAALQFLLSDEKRKTGQWETTALRRCAEKLTQLGAEVYYGPGLIGALSFNIPGADPEEACMEYARRGVALRAGLHCAPLAHETAGTLPNGTVRLSVSGMTTAEEIRKFLEISMELIRKKKV